MSAADVLRTAHAAGISIDLDDGDLVLRAPASPSPALLAMLKGHKAEIVAMLRAELSPEPVVLSTLRGSEEEHKAVVEEGAGVPRAWAEGFARLDPDRPPGDVPRMRWEQFVSDVGRFLDGDFAAVAAALSWGARDLFCCDRDRPFARIDQAGLLWLLNGDQLIALSENTATIETKTGARQTYRRKPNEPGRVLAWELA